MSRAVRILGALLLAAGVGSVLWALVVWQWQDPFTALYTKYEQHKLASSYRKRVETYRPLKQVPVAKPDPFIQVVA